jgi:aryl-alcohol dehydrogenase-like predicted oxidoreductase
LLRDAYEMGVRCFDAADLYGSHDIIADALAPFKRDTYTLFTKIWWRENGIPEKERYSAKVLVPRFMKEFKTDYLDMVQVHCVNKDSWLSEQLKSQGKGLVGMKILGEGSFAGDKNKVDQSIRFALKEAQVDVLNIGFLDVGQIKEIAERIAKV